MPGLAELSVSMLFSRPRDCLSFRFAALCASRRAIPFKGAVLPTPVTASNGAVAVMLPVVEVRADDSPPLSSPLLRPPAPRPSSRAIAFPLVLVTFPPTSPPSLIAGNLFLYNTARMIWFSTSLSPAIAISGGSDSGGEGTVGPLVAVSVCVQGELT